MNRSTRLPLAIAGGLAVAAVGFGAGFGVKALTDDDEKTSSGPSAVTVPGLANSNGGYTGLATTPSNIPLSNPVSTGGGEADAADRAKMGIMPYPGYGCAVVLPASLSSSGLQLANDFVIRTPGDGLELRSFSARGEGPCEGQTDEDVPTSVVVDTNWRHTADDIELNVSQRKADKQTANVIGRGYASVWADGYTYTLNAYSTRVYIADDTKPLPPDSNVASDSAAGIQPSPEDEAAVQAVLVAALQSLAPSVEDQCYAHEVTGDWDDLATLGIGDPRGSIPSGFELTGSYVQFFEPAADGCDTPAPEGLGSTNFWANWSTANGSGYLSINVSGYPASPLEEATPPGQLNNYSANWQKGYLYFNVYGSSDGKEGGLGIDKIRAIATALDPSFDQACYVSEVAIKSGDLGKYNITAPSADGYEIADERLTAWELSAGCEGNESAQPGFSFAWALDDGDITINVNADKSAYKAPDQGQPTGYIAEGNISWMRADGVWMNVSSYGRTGGPGASLETLKEIARQLDPDVNFDELEDGGKVVPLAGEAAAPRR